MLIPFSRYTDVEHRVHLWIL